MEEQNLNNNNKEPLVLLDVTGLTFNQVFDARRVLIDDERLNIEKINCLRWLLESNSLDPDASKVYSESKYLPTFDDDEKLILKGKIFKLINNY